MSLKKLAAQTTVGIAQKQPALGIRVSILAERILALSAAIGKVENEIATLFKSQFDTVAFLL
jgi:hypothetical protein